MLRYLSLFVFIVGVCAYGAWATRADAPNYPWQLPEGFPAPNVPPDNPMSRQKVELGRHLFYDKRLSANGTTACSSCHIQSLAFTDALGRSNGATGEQTPRSSMSLVNVAYNATFDWANANLTSLEIQILRPLFGEDPIEMGLTGHTERVLRDIADDQNYQALFTAAFPDSAERFSWQNGVLAITSFVRSIVSAESAYDDYVRGDEAALSSAQIRGLELFLSERLECFHCHGGFNFTDSSTHDAIDNPPRQFHNTGLYNLANSGRYPKPNEGLASLTGQATDMGRFRAPTLRNIALTSPYMHDGSIATLDDVIDHYAAGGRVIDSGPFAGDGRLNPNKSEFVVGFEISAQERADLIAFLGSLSDTSLLTHPRWSDPFEEQNRDQR